MEAPFSPVSRDRNDPTITPLTLPNRRPTPTAATARDAARMLRTIATLIEQTSNNPYRVAAYRRAASLLSESDRDLHSLLIQTRHGAELDLPGLGERMRRKLGDLLTTGRMGFTVELQPTLPPVARSLLAIRSVGPRTALRLSNELGLTSIADVAVAARHGHIRRLPGFGVRRERQLMLGALQLLPEGLGTADLAAVSQLTGGDPSAVDDRIRRFTPGVSQLPLTEAA